MYQKRLTAFLLAVILLFGAAAPAYAAGARENAAPPAAVLTGTVGSLVPFAEYTYQWFDPINGEYVAKGDFTASAIGTWFAGTRPAATDLALLIQKK